MRAAHEQGGHGPTWRRRVGEALHPGPFRLLSANVTSWGSAGKCLKESGADLICAQEARIRREDLEEVSAAAKVWGYTMHLAGDTPDGALLAMAARRDAVAVRVHPLPQGMAGLADGRV
eukprot:6228395-Lingulodinium_polyedra.AAC.1